MAGSVCGGVTSCCVSDLQLIYVRGSNIKMASCMLDPDGVPSTFPPLWCVLQHSQPLSVPWVSGWQEPFVPWHTAVTALSILCAQGCVPKLATP